MSFDELRRMLIELLHRNDDAPIIGVAKLTRSERMFLLATCSAEILMYTICHTAALNPERAREGLAALEMHKHIDAICNGKEPTYHD